MKRFVVLVMALLMTMLPLTASAASDIYQTAEKCVFENGDTTLPYRLILPENYDESKEYSLLFFFHGAGERGDDNELQFFHCVQYLANNMPETIIVAPQCPLNNQWVDTPWVNGPYSVDNVPESNELKAVIQLLDELKENYSVDSDRIYAAGLSMGGFAVWDLLMRHNDIFAAGIPVCGGGDPSKAELLKDTPIFVFHGDADISVPVSGSRDTVKAITDLGGTKVKYTEYKGKGHGIWNDAFQTYGLLDELLECKLSDRYPEEESSETVSEQSEILLEQSEILLEQSEENSQENEDSGFWSPLTIALIAAAAVIIIGVVLFFVLKK